MEQNMENKVSGTRRNASLKSIKTSPELHRTLKIESAKTGDEMPDVVQKAWDDAQRWRANAATVPIRETGKAVPRKYQRCTGGYPSKRRSGSPSSPVRTYFTHQTGKISTCG